jgi:hypothetical protein
VEAGLSDGTYTEVNPVEGFDLDADQEIAVGLARAKGIKRRPSLKLGGR